MLLNFIPGSKLPLPSLYFEVHVAPFKKKKRKKKEKEKKPREERSRSQNAVNQ